MNRKLQDRINFSDGISWMSTWSASTAVKLIVTIIIGTVSGFDAGHLFVSAPPSVSFATPLWNFSPDSVSVTPSPSPSSSVSTSAYPTPSMSSSPLPSPNVTSVFVAPFPACVDSGVCAAAAPCCSLTFAVKQVAAFMVPLSAFVPVVLGAGDYGVTSCGVDTGRPLAVRGVGGVTIDCGGSGRVLSSSSSLIMSNITLQGSSIDEGDGGAVLIVSNDESPLFVFEGVVFRNNTVSNGDGGALSVTVAYMGEVLDVNVMLIGCNISGNTANGGELTCTFCSPS